MHRAVCLNNRTGKHSLDWLPAQAAAYVSAGGCGTVLASVRRVCVIVVDHSTSKLRAVLAGNGLAARRAFSNAWSSRGSPDPLICLNRTIMPSALR